jgi:alanine dehydrogenase
MKIGVPKEIKDQEYRVALTPDRAAILTAAGHSVKLETEAGAGSGFPDADYARVGADIVSAAEAWDADLVVKVKEPQEAECACLKDQIVFAFLHLAGAPRALTETLLARGTSALAYETLEDAEGRLPLLAPMSAIAGNMAVLAGAWHLARFNGGRGVQLGATLDRRHGRVLVVGDGVVGYHAARSAYGLGAEVAVAGLDAAKGRRMLKEIGPIEFFRSEPPALACRAREADLLVGAVLRRGAKADCVVTEAMVESMRPGSVIVDVSIDQGGCVATSRPTSHSNPVFVKHGVIHYCVTNLPAAYPRTSTLALVEASFPYVLRLAERGLAAAREDPGLARAVNVHRGYLTCRPVAEAFGWMELYRGFAA